MPLGPAYASDPGRALGARITPLMPGTCYAASAEMAAELGAFPGFAKNREAMLRVIRNHRRAAHGDSGGHERLTIPPVPFAASDCPDQPLAAAARAAWDAALALGDKHGFRN